MPIARRPVAFLRRPQANPHPRIVQGRMGGRWVGTLLVASALLVGPVASLAAAAGPPPGAARIWIYRIDDPHVTQQTPVVRINGAAVALARLGSRFHRDVPSGTYRITTDSQGTAPNQFTRVTLAAGETVFVKVDADNWWASANCETAVVTFYTLAVAPQLAEAEMASLPAGDGG